MTTRPLGFNDVNKSKGSGSLSCRRKYYGVFEWYLEFDESD